MKTEQSKCFEAVGGIVFNRGQAAAAAFFFLIGKPSLGKRHLGRDPSEVRRQA